MQPDQPGDIRPNPDPTRLTIAALEREMARVEKEYDLQFAALRQQLEHQLAALRDFHDSDVAHAREVLEQKLNEIDHRFRLRDEHRVESKHDQEKTVAAAMTHATESLRQHSDSIKEQLTALGSTYATAHAALVGVVDDVKSRVTQLEAMRMGGKESSSSTYAVVGVLLTVVWIAITVLALYHH